MRRSLLSLVPLVAVALATPIAGAAENAAQRQTGTTEEYVVVYDQGAADAARAAISAMQGAIVRENAAVGVATVQSSDANFVANLSAQPGIDGVARNTSIGTAPQGAAKPKAERDEVEKAGRIGTNRRPRQPGPRPDAEPLADLQWNMQQINATVDGSYRVNQGDERVLVGILDTGVDGTHPDIAPNFSDELSRNFTVDIPADADGNEIDGPCADEPDQSCNDAANVDEDGHGTHVASTIGSPINGHGIAGVAPNVTLVNIRGGQDSGYFFLQPTVDALTYAGDVGIDVVNMSFYVDPWLFNCTDNPADSPEDQQEQRTIIEAVQRALDYAHRNGVTLVGAAGNGATDYTKTIIDESSPDFASQPGEVPYPRDIDPSCVSMPSEGNHVIPVSATGPSTRKAYYSDYGNGYIDVAAPGGDAYDTPDGTLDVGGLVLAAYPENVARAIGDIDENGDPTNDFVIRDCSGGTCAYFQYLQGTSMAAPHASGVAALIVSRYGREWRDGFGFPPNVVESRLRFSATAHACPTPNPYTYVRFVPLEDGSTERRESTQECEGNLPRNGFYGRGIVDALAAVGR